MQTQITASIIDVLGFYAGNAIVHKVYPEGGKVKIDDAFIFLLADILARNTSYLDDLIKDYKYDEKNKRNAIIALLYIIIKSLDDSFRHNEMKLKQNIIKGLVGMITNSGVDMFLPPRLT